jgi:hypothetical protein
MTFTPKLDRDVLFRLELGRMLGETDIASRGSQPFSPQVKKKGMDSRSNGRHEGELLKGGYSFHGVGQPLGENRPYRGGKHRSTVLRHDSPSTNFLFRRYHCCNSHESTEQYIDFIERHIAIPQLYREPCALITALIQFANICAASPSSRRNSIHPLCPGTCRAPPSYL